MGRCFGFLADVWFFWYWRGYDTATTTDRLVVSQSGGSFASDLGAGPLLIAAIALAAITTAGIGHHRSADA